MAQIKIGLVEDQLLFREGIKAILEAHPDMEVIFESGDGYSVINSLQKCTTRPDVMLVDLSLPADGTKEYNGLNLTLGLQEHFPSIKVLILSMHADEYFIAQLIEEGAQGYLVKDSDPQEVIDAIWKIHTKGSYINERTLKAIQNKLGNKIKGKKLNETLTKREIEVLKLTCQQLTAEEIAERLFISVKTVNGHRNNLLQKTNSRNVTGLVLYAVKHNIVDIL
ncbi:MAG: DNA-binding response regulator [Crocinitomicaceae bacterium]|nr:DNA-binding response regulator [Crocinitomicaceae bacterium]|tara:strand:+ start:3227 stop:3895 length:669 start_codon:yes stop_codon:yes gene_type:complete